MASIRIYPNLTGSANGFTLIELLMSLTLGMLISGAALALFLESAKNKRAQESLDDIQDAAVFGLHYLQKEIAMANLGANRPMTASMPAAGLLLSVSVAADEHFIGNLAGFGHHQKLVPVMSQNNSHPANIKEQGSDQLTIMYTAPFKMVNCEGGLVDKGQVVVERIFTRAASTSAKNELVLACNAGSYDRPTAFGSSVSHNQQYAVAAAQLLDKLGAQKKGSVLINRVDYFAVKLGVISPQGLQYIAIDDYCAGGCDALDEMMTPAALSAVVAIQLGVIVRSRSPVGSAMDSEYQVLGDKVILDSHKTDNTYSRRVLEKTIRLKNSVLPAHQQVN